MQVLSYNQAAARANLCRRSFERLIALGTGPAIVEVSNSAPRDSRSRLRSLALVPPPGGARRKRQGRLNSGSKDEPGSAGGGPGSGYVQRSGERSPDTTLPPRISSRTSRAPVLLVSDRGADRRAARFLEWESGVSARYQASHIKRARATKAEVERRRLELHAIIEAMRPMTVRQVFYQATVKGLVEKSEAGYAKVQTDLALMRRDGELPYDWLVDNTRMMRKPRSVSSIKQALDDTARLYRKDLWAEADCYVEIWLEKDALSGVVYPVTSLYDAPLMVARGYASLSFLHGAADYIKELEVPTYLYHMGDFDPSGVNAGQKIESTLREMAPDAEIHFERIAVTLEQIREWDLPTRPTKTSDSRSKGFGDISVELDAIPPTDLRDLVTMAIEQHLPKHQLDILKIAEAEERKLLRGLVGLMEAHL